jgi:hypothetical protein
MAAKLIGVRGALTIAIWQKVYDASPEPFCIVLGSKKFSRTVIGGNSGLT